MNNVPVLKCDHLSKVFNESKNPVEVLRSVDLVIESAQRVAIIGTSGAGKSTLLHLLGGLDTPTQGDVWIHGNNVSQMSTTQRGRVRNQSLGFIYQFHHLLPEFTALENVCMPLLIRGGQIENIKRMAKELLERVGLGHRITHKPGELSGGERQRVAFARALVTKPQCVLADEPTGNLDKKNADKLFSLMLELNEEYKTSFVIVTHELSLADKMDTVYVLDDGTLALS